MAGRGGRNTAGKRCRNAAAKRTPCCASCTLCTAGAASYRVALSGIELNTSSAYLFTGTCSGTVTTFTNQYAVSAPGTYTRDDLCIVSTAALFGTCVWQCVRPLRDVGITASMTVQTCSGDGLSVTTSTKSSGCDLFLIVAATKTSETTVNVSAWIAFGLTGGPRLLIFSCDTTTTAEDCLPLDTELSNDITDWGSTTLPSGSGTNALGKNGTLTITDERCDCDESNCVTALASYGDNSIQFFKDASGTDVIFPAGDYDVKYLCGAVSYTPAGTRVYSVNKDGTTGYRIVDHTGSVLGTAPGGTTTYARQGTVENTEGGDSTSVTLSADGKIGVKLVGVTTYTDLALDSDDPDPAPPSFLICNVNGCFEVTGIVTGPTVQYFNGGASFPAGTYKVTYKRGSMLYGPDQGHRVNADPNGFNFRINGQVDHGFLGIYEDDITEAPGDSTEYLSQGACEAANAGASVTFTTDGDGPIGISLNDTPYTDNTADSPAPTFELCPVT
jgi:hypothetical protein